jgi:hypothetical protein
MRATVLLFSSVLALGACGRQQKVELTGKLVMSTLPADWCGQNKDQIRLDCPFEMGFYVIDASSDAGPGVVKKTVCASLDKDPMRRSSNLAMDLNSVPVTLDGIMEGQVRVEVAIIEPPANNGCEYESSMANAAMTGKSKVLDLMGTDVPNRYDIVMKCVKTFSACP